MKTQVETLCIYTSDRRSPHIGTTIVSVGDEVWFEKPDGTKEIGQVMQISTMGHCWIKHSGNKLDAVPYNYIGVNGEAE